MKHDQMPPHEGHVPGSRETPEGRPREVRPKQRVPMAYGEMRPGSQEAVRKGCKCSTITGAISPYCPHHQRGYSNT